MAPDLPVRPGAPRLRCCDQGPLTGAASRTHQTRRNRMGTNHQPQPRPWLHALSAAVIATGLTACHRNCGAALEVLRVTRAIDAGRHAFPDTGAWRLGAGTSEQSAGTKPIRTFRHHLLSFFVQARSSSPKPPRPRAPGRGRRGTTLGLHPRISGRDRSRRPGLRDFS